MRHGLAVLIVVFWGVLCCRASEFDNVAGIFELGSGGRPWGMGGAFLAVADDENAAYYNPAGLAWIDGIGVTSLFSRQLESVTHGAFGVILPHFGLVLMHLDSGLISVNEGGDAFRYTSQAGLLSTGVALGPVALGGRWKLYRVLEPYTASGWALDPTLLVITEGVRVGLMLENILSKPITFESDHVEPWKMRTRFGAAVSLEAAEAVRWCIAVEACDLFSSRPHLAAGLEAWMENVAGRVGYDGTNATLGLTVQFSNFQVDWGTALGIGLVASHRISLTFRF